jgi:hypothetical protein
MMYLVYDVFQAAPICELQSVPAMDNKKQMTISYSNGLDKINLSMQIKTTIDKHM